MHSTMTSAPAGAGSASVTVTSLPSTTASDAASRRSRPTSTVVFTFSAPTVVPSGISMVTEARDSSSAVWPCHVTRVAVAPRTVVLSPSLFGLAVQRSTSSACAWTGKTNETASAAAKRTAAAPARCFRANANAICMLTLSVRYCNHLAASSSYFPFSRTALSAVLSALVSSGLSLLTAMAYCSPVGISLMTWQSV